MDETHPPVTAKAVWRGRYKLAREFGLKPRADAKPRKWKSYDVFNISDCIPLTDEDQFQVRVEDLKTEKRNIYKSFGHYIRANHIKKNNPWFYSVKRISPCEVRIVVLDSELRCVCDLVIDEVSEYSFSFNGETCFSLCDFFTKLEKIVLANSFVCFDRHQNIKILMDVCRKEKINIDFLCKAEHFSLKDEFNASWIDQLKGCYNFSSLNGILYEVGLVSRMESSDEDDADLIYYVESIAMVFDDAVEAGETFLLEIAEIDSNLEKDVINQSQPLTLKEQIDRSSIYKDWIGSGEIIRDWNRETGMEEIPGMAGSIFAKTKFHRDEAYRIEIDGCKLYSPEAQEMIRVQLKIRMESYVAWQKRTG